MNLLSSAHCFFSLIALSTPSLQKNVKPFNVWHGLSNMEHCCGAFSLFLFVGASYWIFIIIHFHCLFPLYPFLHIFSIFYPFTWKSMLSCLFARSPIGHYICHKLNCMFRSTINLSSQFEAIDTNAISIIWLEICSADKLKCVVT